MKDVDLTRRYVLLESDVPFEVRQDRNDSMVLNLYAGRYKIDTSEMSYLEVSDDVDVRGTNIDISFMSSLDGLPVSGPLTDVQMRASAVPVSLASVPSHVVTGPVTNTELRASAVPVSLASVPSHAVTGPVTNTELRASAVPVSLASVPSHAVTGPLTDTQLRASSVTVKVGRLGVMISGNGTSLETVLSGMGSEWLLAEGVAGIKTTTWIIGELKAVKRVAANQYYAVVVNNSGMVFIVFNSSSYSATTYYNGSADATIGSITMGLMYGVVIL
jgi:hypothetical protein